MPTFKCTNCNEYKRTRHDAGCHSSCNSNCREVCETCGRNTLISMDVARITDDLGISRSNPILKMAVKYISEVEDPNHWRTEAHMTIKDWDWSNRDWVSPMVIEYKKGGYIRSYQLH